MGRTITFFEAKDWEKEVYFGGLKARLGDRLNEFEVEFVPYSLKKETASEHSQTEIAIIYLNSFIDEEVLEKTKNLKFIITRTTGMDHIDLLACQRRGIQVANAPLYADVTVAEHAVALMFALAKRLKLAIEKMKAFDFSRDGLLGFDLYGKIAGVIGTGRIGSHICRITHGLGMKVIGYDLYPKDELRDRYNVEYTSLDELLKTADVIFLALPYTKGTHHLLNHNNLKLVKDEAMLINVARGPIIDTSALIWALENGKLRGGVALDVFEGEKVLTERSYLKEEVPSEILKRALQTLYLYPFPNFILTPHVAYYTKEALTRLVENVIEEITHFCLYKSGVSSYHEFF